MEQIKLTVNGKDYELQVRPWATLLEVIREDLGLTGAKEGCGEGECGACTVIMDGKAVNSCIVLAVEANGRQITTIEGLAEGDKLHPVQEAFLEKGGMQCGFCTPGMILSTKILLDGNKNPTDEEIRKGLEGNFCRCTGYTKIFESVKAAAQKVRG
ncbi:MAG TPA: (2Fe-2S)-binding protein [Syntrophorhabdaceae bacterium]|nr:(2Fe-2S)-binding protein [Syntrophorhabdaceae bacterium]HNT67971.1 (2Fe-2S)-binding protein [Syntrophorhabdaceae bacterium]